MDCCITYVGKMRNGTCKYWCSAHKALASDKQGNKLDSCLNENKEKYTNGLSIEENTLKNIKIVFTNILNNKVPIVYVNGELFDGVFLYQDCVLDYKDLVGLLLAKLNHTPLETVRCSHCNHYHSDNGKFAYTPHSTHLCLYCGHFFRVKEANVGSELATFFSLPTIKLEKGKIEIKDICSVTYDMIGGEILINDTSVDTVVIQKEKFSLAQFLNKNLKDLY